MDKINLSPRLAAIAGFIREGARVADVGTDHGYIPIWLLQNGIADSVIAADINREPLESARRSAKAAGLDGRISFVLCDGLSGCEAGCADTVVIAGMGGETIVKILENAQWLECGKAELILQPQTKLEELGAYLREHGWRLCDARFVRDAGRIYQVWRVSQDAKGELFGEGAQLLVNRVLIQKRDPLCAEYIDTLLGKYAKALAGMEISGQVSENEKQACAAALRTLADIKLEVGKWQE